MLKKNKKYDAYKVKISSLTKAAILLRKLQSSGFNVNIYHLPGKDSDIEKNSDHEAIWLGNKVPVEMATEVIKINFLTT